MNTSMERYIGRVPASIRDLAPARLKQIAFEGSGGQSGAGLPFWSNFQDIHLPGSKRNWAAEAGDAWDSSLIAPLIHWTARTIGEAPMVLMRPTDGQGQSDEILRDDPLLALLRRPAPWMTGNALMMATALSYITDGNAYWLKERNGAGTAVTRLRYLPHTAVEPRWPKDGTAFLSHYDYRVNNQTVPLPLEDVVHFKWGIDPRNERKGLGPIRSALREIAGDNHASTWIASLLKNTAIPGVVVSDKSEDPLDADERKALAERIGAMAGGDQRGGVLVVSGDMEVQHLAFSPQAMDLGGIRQFFESRVCALVGLNPVVLGFLVGMEHSTYNNQEEARKAAYLDYLVPLKRALADVVELQLQPEFSDDATLIVDYDYTRVRCLQEDQDKLATRGVALYQGGLVTRTEGRRIVGQEEDPNDPERDAYFKKAAPPAPNDSNAQDAQAAQDALAKALAGDQVLASFFRGWQPREGGQ